MIPLEHVIGLSAVLFAIGAVGVLARRNVIVVLMSIELMLGAANLAFVGFNRAWAQDEAAALDGQVFALLVIAIAAAQVALGLAIVVAAFRNRASLDLEEASLMRW